MSDKDKEQSVQSQAILTNLATDPNNGTIGPRGTASFMDRPFGDAVTRPKFLPVPSAEELAFKRDTQLMYNSPRGIEPSGDMLSLLTNNLLERPDHKLDPLLAEPLDGKKIPFDEPRQFAPVFNAEVARRHLYKNLILRMNEEIKKGPLAGLISIIGVHRENDPSVLMSVTFTLSVKTMKDKQGREVPSFKAMNRSRAYATYFTELRRKYILEIRTEEEKVLERE